jgi:hypothetical protein
MTQAVIRIIEDEQGTYVELENEPVSGKFPGQHQKARIIAQIMASWGDVLVKKEVEELIALRSLGDEPPD